MSCGCNSKAAAAETDRRRAAAVMCMICPERVGDSCGLTGLTVERAVIEGKCKHHPDADGVVRWADLEWYGVPVVQRGFLRLLTALGSVRRLSAPLGGCGCIKPLRDRWEAWRPRLAQWAAVARTAATGRL